MNFIRTEIPDVVICEPKVFGDDRGYFSETFREDELYKFLGYKINFCQDNESKSTFGVLRGLHYQLAPFTQTKLVRVITGTVLDVAVDMRNGSPTFGKHVAIELSSDNKKQLLIPKGFAHGFVVLSEQATCVYKVDNYYNLEAEKGVLYNDKNLGINWKIVEGKICLSEKDSAQPSFENAEHFGFN